MRCRICASSALAALGEVKGFAFVECGRCGFVDGLHGGTDGAPENGRALFLADPYSLDSTSNAIALARPTLRNRCCR